MPKDTVFFSHSSLDKACLSRLKDSLAEKTDNSIDLFLSTDGQSIKLGSNWVHRVEEALEDCKLMFVFVSPNSLNSHWVHFEAGFAYCRGIEVIPVGILGVGLEHVPPPLSLLQGFNVASHDGLNNIIVELNRAFEHTHSESFTPEEFSAIMGVTGSSVDSVFGELTPWMDELRFSVPVKPDTELDDIERRLTDAQAESQAMGSGLSTFGATYSLRKAKAGLALDANLDAGLASVALPVLDRLLADLRQDTKTPLQFQLVFVRGVGHLTERHKMTGRLFGTEVTLGRDDFLVYDNLRFRIWHYNKPSGVWWGGTSGFPPPYAAEPDRTYLDLEYEGERTVDAPMQSLVRTLFEQGVLYILQ